MNNQLELFRHKMEDEGLPEIVIQTFEYYYQKLVKGDTGFLPESEIAPVSELETYNELDGSLVEYGESISSKSVLIKLNGGLGTSMGLSEAKSLLKIKNDFTFLDIIAKQTEINKNTLILMNSYNTQKKSLELLEKYPSVANNLPLDFLQHKIPKIDAQTSLPAEYPQDKSLEWCPPGHGEVYTALVTSGLLNKLLEAGIEYAFISNSDNLGAVMDYKILGYFSKNKFPFLMEVADRTESDKKGGHLAKMLNGQLVLRESAQCPQNDFGEFQNIAKHKYFNTNNIWLNLKDLKQVMEEKNNILGLPMIVNKKNVNPQNPNSTDIFQLETAMGSAISVFNGANALSVPRSRFAPVKTTEDLLSVRSDNYVLTDDYRIILNPLRELGPLKISLDKNFYKMVSDLDMRIPNPPSLLNCDSLEITGDFRIGKNVVFRGNVGLENPDRTPIILEDNTTIG